jgi:hypothetical protein
MDATSFEAAGFLEPMRKGARTMRLATLLLAAALGCGAVTAQAVTAQAATATAAHPHPVVVPQQPGQNMVEPQAVEALVKMSAYLRTLQNFQVTLQTQRDDVDVYGQLITLGGTATYRVRRPDGLTIDMATPEMTRHYVYDGKTVTIFDPGTGYFAKIPAPGTIRETLDMAAEKYGVELPLADLFTWSEGDGRAKSLTSAHFIGKTDVNGVAANHYAFRQPGIDWQIWIADGDKPAPLRAVIVASDDPARPQFQADLAWDMAPQFAQDTFAFTPPASARQIQIHPLAER